VAWGLRNISSRELSEWEAFYGLEPFGERKADYRAGIIAATVANVNLPSGHQAMGADDFFPEPQFDEAEDDEEPWVQQLAMAELITAAYGGQDLRSK
jgi:hypothetical protein